jgi:hypothetical protein
MSHRQTVRRKALALAVSVRWHREEYVFWRTPGCRPKDARELHFAAKKLLAAGINPMGERKAEAEAKREEVKALQRETDSSMRP